MRTMLSLVGLIALLATLAACSQPPASPSVNHGAQNLYSPGAIPAPVDAARV